MNRILWKAKLDSSFNERYWRLITEKYARWDVGLKLLLAIAASGTVASWGVFEEFPILWKSLSASAALASIASPLLAFNRKVEAASSHAGKWASLRVRCESLWDEWSSKHDEPDIKRRFERLQQVLAELSRVEAALTIPLDDSLARRAQKDVLKSID